METQFLHPSRAELTPRCPPEVLDYNSPLWSYRLVQSRGSRVGETHREAQQGRLPCFSVSPPSGREGKSSALGVCLGGCWVPTAGCPGKRISEPPSVSWMLVKEPQGSVPLPCLPLPQVWRRPHPRPCCRLLGMCRLPKTPADGGRGPLPGRPGWPKCFCPGKLGPGLPTSASLYSSTLGRCVRSPGHRQEIPGTLPCHRH